MKIKTSELIGDALDWAVATIGGVELHRPSMFGGRCVPTDDSADFYSPATDWAQGGPLIEREEICVDRLNKDRWCANHRPTPSAGWLYGPTPLIAAMRCFVASKLGNEVEIPDELCFGQPTETRLTLDMVLPACGMEGASEPPIAVVFPNKE